MEKLNRVQKCSILGPQNLGSRGGPGPRGPPWIRTWQDSFFIATGTISNIKQSVMVSKDLVGMLPHLHFTRS